MITESNWWINNIQIASELAALEKRVVGLEAGLESRIAILEKKLSSDEDTISRLLRRASELTAVNERLSALEARVTEL